MVTVKNIYKAYGEKQVLSDISFVLNKQGLYLVTGASGIGKTTLFRIIAGFEKQDAGVVEVNGKMAFVFQENRLFPWFNLEKNILLPTVDADKAAGLLTYFGLEGDKHLLPSQISGGMQRRVELIRAFASDFDLLLLDEPFNGLDDQNALLVAQLIEKTAAEKCVMLVSHDDRFTTTIPSTSIII